MDIMKLGDDLLAMIINQLPALDQVAVSRVSKTFTKYALKTTTVLDVEDIPHEHRLEVVKKMPKLVSIVGLGMAFNGGRFEDSEEVSFVDRVAKINKNIVHFRSLLHEKELITTYIESAKKSEANFTGSHVRRPFRYEAYKN